MAKSQKSQSNILVGAQVLIDWPVRWSPARGFDAKYADEAKVEATKKEAYFGQTGVVVAYNPGSEKAEDLVVKLDESGCLVRLYEGAVTVVKLPSTENDVVAALDCILEEVRGIAIRLQNR